MENLLHDYPDFTGLTGQEAWEAFKEFHNLSEYEPVFFKAEDREEYQKIIERISFYDGWPDIEEYFNPVYGLNYYLEDYKQFLSDDLTIKQKREFFQYIRREWNKRIVKEEATENRKDYLKMARGILELLKYEDNTFSEWLKELDEKKQAGQEEVKINSKPKYFHPSISPEIVFTEEIRRAILNDLNPFIKSEDSHQLKKLTRGEPINDKIIFLGNANRLAAYFADLIEAQKVNTTNRSAFEKWLKSKFKYCKGKEVKPLPDLKDYFYLKKLPKDKIPHTWK